MKTFHLSIKTFAIALLLLTITNFGWAQSPTNPGFENNSPLDWTNVGSAYNSFAQDNTYEKTGTYDLLCTENLATASEGRSVGSISVTNGTYAHIIGYVRGNNNDCRANVGIYWGASYTTNASYTQPSTSGYTRITYARNNNTGSTQTAYASLLGYRNGGGTNARSFYWDDIVIYTSNSSTTDIIEPTAATGFTNGTIASNSVTFTWTNGVDATTNPGYTGIQNTWILRTTNTSAATPLPNDQGQYSTAGGTSGPNTVGTDWTILSTSVASGTTTYTDNTVSANTSYKYAVIHRDAAYNYSTALVSGTITTLATEPTTQATAVTFSTVSATSMTIGWTNGNGSNRIVLMKAGSAVDYTPIDGTSYTANTAFGSGTQYGTGNYVVYNSTGNSVTVTGLTANTTYYVAVYEFNGSGTTVNYLTTSPATGNKTTLVTAPSPATSVTVTSRAVNTIGISWTNGSGAGRIVVARLNSTAAVAPTGGTAYTANSTSFTDPLNSTTGTGNIVVYNGTGSSVTITGLTAATAYNFNVYEYNGSAPTINYAAAASSGSTYTLATEPTGQASAVTFSNVSTTTLTVGWTAGTGGTGRIVLMKAGSAVDYTPIDGTSYTANTAFGSGTQYGTGNYVVSFGNSTTVNVTNLSANTIYYVAVYEYSGSSTGITYNYLLTGPATGNQLTAPLAPTANAATNITTSSFTANWNASAGATGYRLDVSVSNTFSSFVTGFNNLDVGNVTTYDVSGITPGVYYYRLRSYNTGGTSLSSNVITVTMVANYRSNVTTGNWNAIGSWQVFDGTNWVAAGVVPSDANSDAITILSGHTITVNAAVSVDQVTVDDGGKVIVNNVTFTITNGAAATDFTVNGELNLTGNSGVITTTGALLFGSSGIYTHNRNGGVIPTAAWNAASTCLITGITNTTPTGLGQSFGNFTWNCIGQTGTRAMNNNVIVQGDFLLTSTGSGWLALTNNTTSRSLTVQGNFTQSGGQLDFSSGNNGAIANIYVAGNFTHSASAESITTGGNGATNGRIVFNGSSQQLLTFTDPGGATWTTYVINSGSNVKLASNLALFGSNSDAKYYADIIVNGVLDVGTYTVTETANQSGASHFTINTGATLITANTSGVPGCIGSATITTSYNSAASYSFNGTAAQVTGSFTTTPTANTVNNFTVSNTSGSALTLTNAALTVSAAMTIDGASAFELGNGKSLTVNGTLTNNSGNDGLIIKDGGSLIHNTANIPATVERSITGNVYHMISSPLTSTPVTSSLFASNTLLLRYDEPTHSWKNLHYGDVMEAGKGYSANLNPGATVSFQGTLNVGDLTMGNLTSTAPNAPDFRGWNLLGNPFASALNAGTTALGWTSSNIDLYVYVWDPAISNYRCQSLPETSGGTNTPSTLSGGIIPAQQGFFVHVLNGQTGSLTIPYTARVHNSASLYKNSTEVVSNCLYFNVTGNGLADMGAVYFNDGATSGFDSKYDAYKLTGAEEAPQLYSIIPDNILTVNGLPSIESNSTVDLGFKVGTAGTYTLTLTGMESFDASIPLRLDDLLSGASYDLRTQSVIEIEASPGDVENRFRLRFASNVDLDEPDIAGIGIYSEEGRIVVDNSSNQKTSIQICNMAGKQLSTLNLNPGKNIVQVNAAGVYLVKIRTSHIVVSRKVVVL